MESSHAFALRGMPPLLFNEIVHSSLNNNNEKIILKSAEYPNHIFLVVGMSINVEKHVLNVTCKSGGKVDMLKQE